MKDKVVWITGASSGIGEALVYACNQAGAKLIISARNRDELFRVKANCENQLNIHVFSFDLTNTAELAGRTVAAQQIYGRIDLLINSAGLSQRSTVLDTSLNVEQQLMNVNFWATVGLSKAVLPSMVARGSGKIVAISSVSGKFGRAGRAAYCASKHALHGYMDSLRTEIFNQNIQILLVCPGYIQTSLSVHALTAGGAPHGILDETQQQGLSAAACARQIMKAIVQNREEVYIGGKELKGVLFKRLFPLWFSRYMRKK